MTGSNISPKITVVDTFETSTTIEATPHSSPAIFVSEGFESVVVRTPDVRIEILPNGNIAVETPGLVTTAGWVALGSGARKIGAIMPDGSVFAGISPDTGKPMYTTPTDARSVRTFNAAAKFVSKLRAHGHNDWRVPSKAELNVLFQNRTAIGGFNITGAEQKGWYWSSTRDNPNPNSASHNSLWLQRFSDGCRGNFYHKNTPASLRCVRC